jgi:hypothetical protein
MHCDEFKFPANIIRQRIAIFPTRLRPVLPAVRFTWQRIEAGLYTSLSAQLISPQKQF